MLGVGEPPSGGSNPAKTKGSRPKPPSNRKKPQPKKLLVSHTYPGCDEEQKRIAEAAGIPVHFSKTNPHSGHCILATKRVILEQFVNTTALRDGCLTAVDYGSNGVRQAVTKQNPMNPDRLTIHPTVPVDSNDANLYYEEQRRFEQTRIFYPDVCQHKFGECTCRIMNDEGEMEIPDCFVSTDSLYYASNFDNIYRALQATRTGTGYALLNIYAVEEEEVTVTYDALEQHVLVRGNTHEYVHPNMAFLLRTPHVQIDDNGNKHVISIQLIHSDVNAHVFKFKLLTTQTMRKLHNVNTLTNFYSYFTQCNQEAKPNPRTVFLDKLADEYAASLLGKSYDGDAALSRTASTIQKLALKEGVKSVDEVNYLVKNAIRKSKESFTDLREDLVPDTYEPKGFKLRALLQVERIASIVTKREIDLGGHRMMTDEYLNLENQQYNEALNAKMRRKTAETTMMSTIWKHISNFSKLKPGQVLLLVALGCLVIKLVLLLLPMLASVPWIQTLGILLINLVSMFMGLFSPQSTRNVAGLPAVMNIIPSFLVSLF
jgi:hypothetical protein